MVTFTCPHCGEVIDPNDFARYDSLIDIRTGKRQIRLDPDGKFWCQLCADDWDRSEKGETI